jgi:carbon-monoxide dehydrogenase small subunit
MKLYKENVQLKLLVNDNEYNVVVRPSDTLLFVLREKLGLTGAKPGCENGDCGACTVLIDDIPIKSCITLAIEAEGHSITTVEGIRNTAIQREFINKWGFQCGYCTSGFIVNCYSLINTHPNANDEIIEEWLQSNICRCTSYDEIKKAVKKAMKEQII